MSTATGKLVCRSVAVTVNNKRTTHPEGTRGETVKGRKRGEIKDD
jgi:hypothetical protein